LAYRRDSFNIAFSDPQEKMWTWTYQGTPFRYTVDEEIRFRVQSVVFKAMSKPHKPPEKALVCCLASVTSPFLPSVLPLL